jgi:hypothetical protein
MGEEARPMLLEYRKHRSAEVRDRVERLLAKPGAAEVILLHRDRSRYRPAPVSGKLKAASSLRSPDPSSKQVRPRVETQSAADRFFRKAGARKSI